VHAPFYIINGFRFLLHCRISNNPRDIGVKMITRDYDPTHIDVVTEVSFSFPALYLLKRDLDSTLDSSHFYGLEFMSCFDRWWICPLLIHFLSPLVTPTPFYQYSRISV
jgi:hypothetical protein